MILHKVHSDCLVLCKKLSVEMNLAALTAIKRLYKDSGVIGQGRLLTTRELGLSERKVNVHN